MFKYDYLLKKYDIENIYDKEKNMIFAHNVILYLYNDVKIGFFVMENDISKVFNEIDNKLIEVFISLRNEKINKIRCITKN
ncbi:MAG: hypothetical protein WDA02_09950 [Saccharofermentanales bacterium]